MSKTDLTKDLESDFLAKLYADGERAINECSLGRHGIVDVISYSSKLKYIKKPGNKNRTRTREQIWKCFEIKTSKADFYSKSKWTFVGDFNYFVMPVELYKEIEKDVPTGVGVIGYSQYPRSKFDMTPVGVFDTLKRATRAKPKMSQEDLTAEVMSSMSRELSKSRYGERGIRSIESYELSQELIRRLEIREFRMGNERKLIKLLNKD